MYLTDNRKFRIMSLIAWVLDEEDEATGWTIWEAVVEEAAGIESLDKPEVFKSVMRDLEVEGLIAKTGRFDNSMKKGKHWGTAVWLANPTLIEALKNGHAEREAAGPVGGGTAEERTAESCIKKRIRADRPVTRAVWKELMAMHKAGRVDIVFMPRVTITND